MKLYSVWNGKKMNKFEVVLNSIEFINNYLTVEKFANDIEQTVDNTSNFLSYYRNGLQKLDIKDYKELARVIPLDSFSRWLNEYHCESVCLSYDYKLSDKKRLVEYAIKHDIIKPLRFDFDLLQYV
jgi:hypothetical protein